MKRLIRVALRPPDGRRRPAKKDALKTGAKTEPRTDRTEEAGTVPLSEHRFADVGLFGAPVAVGVERIPLPHREVLEARLGRRLDHLEIVTGPGVAAALRRLGAEAATRGRRVYLASPDADLATVAHEVVHALQADVSRPSVEEATGEMSHVLPAEAAAEHEASRVGAALAAGAPAAPVSMPLPVGAVALLRAGAGQKTPEDLLRDATQEPAQKADSKGKTADAGAAGAGAGDVKAGDAGAAQPVLEKPKPTFAVQAMPETKLSPEEKARRDAAAEEAKEAIAKAEDVGGVVDAFAEASPTVKAQAQASLGRRIDEVTRKDHEKLRKDVPVLEVRMGGEIAEGAVPAVKAPQPGEVSLEKGEPPAAKGPDLPPTVTPEKYRGNDKVPSVLDRFFSLFGLGRDSIDKSMTEVKTSDKDIETSPGPKPKVPLTKGTATDPDRVEAQQKEGREQSAKARDQAIQGVIDGPGPEQAKLKELKEERRVGELARPEVEAVKPADGAAKLQAAAVPEEVLAQLDKDSHDTMRGNLAETRAKTREAEKQRDDQRKAKLEEAQHQHKAQIEQADTSQRAEVLEARKTIQSERQSTLDSQSKAVRDLETKAEAQRKDSRKKISDRVKADEKQVSKKYDEKEKEAKAEVTSGEKQAEAKRKQAKKESKEQSWWDRAKSWVKEAFAKLTAAIGKIFDRVRAFVKTALDAARKFAKDLIDKAAAFVKSAIEAFGTLMKGLVNTLLADTFPGLARKLNEKIDKAVAAAKKAVDVVADKLKKGVDAIVNALQKGLDAIVKAFQAALNFAVNLLQAALTGDWAAVFKMLLEATLKLLGIKPAEFYRFIAKVKKNLDLIVKNPGKFLTNLLGAVKLGFSKLAKNFGKHLLGGILGWLTGSLGVDIQMPKKLDLLGVLDLARQVMGLTWEWLKKRAAKIVGEKNVERLEVVFGYVKTLRKEGWKGLFKQIKGQLAGLKDQVLEKIKELLITKVVIAGITWLGSLFNPVGALVKLVMTIWNVYTFLRDQLSRIGQVVKTVVESLDKIARGVLKTAGEKIESVLGQLMPIVIDLLAKLLGLTGVTAKVKEILRSVNKAITKAVDKVLKKIAKAFRGKKVSKPRGKGRKVDAAAKAQHRKIARGVLTKIDKADAGKTLPERIKNKKQVAKKLINQERRKLKKGLVFTVKLNNEKEALATGKLSWSAKIAPNTTLETLDEPPEGFRVHLSTRLVNLTEDQKTSAHRSIRNINSGIGANIRYIFHAAYQSGDRYGIAAALAATGNPNMDNHLRAKSQTPPITQALGAVVLTNQTTEGASTSIENLYKQATKGLTNENNRVHKLHLGSVDNNRLKLATTPSNIQWGTSANNLTSFLPSQMGTTYGTDFIGSLMRLGDQAEKQEIISRQVTGWKWDGSDTEEESKKEALRTKLAARGITRTPKYALVWVKSGAPGDEKSWHYTAVELVDDIKRIAGSISRTPLRIGDKLSASESETSFGTPHLVQYWDKQWFKEIWPELINKSRVAQVRLIRLLAKEYQVTSLGMRSGTLEATGVFGIPTIYFEEKANMSRVRLEKLLKTIPNLHRIVLHLPPGKQQREDFKAHLEVLKIKFNKADPPNEEKIRELGIRIREVDRETRLNLKDREQALISAMLERSPAELEVLKERLKNEYDSAIESLKLELQAKGAPDVRRARDVKRMLPSLDE